MKTPEQIRDMEFQKSPMGGYKQSDVELFLEEVASQIEILMKQKNEAERKLQELSKRAPEAALSTAGIQSVLVNAQRVAEQVIDEAKANAEGIVNDANVQLNEAGVKAREILADAESKAVLLGSTAETEAAKIIAEAMKEAERIVAEAKESVELEQKLYDRMKIEIADFRKKAAAQMSALLELINQLPDDIPFNIERSKAVLSVDFSDPAELLKAAVEARLAKEQAEKAAEPVVVEEPAPVAEPVAEPIAPVIPEAPAPVEEAPVVVAPTADVEVAEEAQLSFGDSASVTVEVAEPEEEAVPFVAPPATEDQPKPKGHISFVDDDDDDDDDDDEPRLFFRRKKK